MERTFVIISLIFTLLCCVVKAALKDGECEVCVKVVEKLQKDVSDDQDTETIENNIRKFCAKARDKENRFCYYIGGTEDAATGLLKQISGPLKNYLPPQKICEKLKKLDSQICELKYDKPIDWKNINLKKMRVKELKKILANWDEDCKGCVEKQEFIDKIEKLKQVYVREEL